MRRIPLTKGYFALVDDADYEMLSRFKWQVNVLPRAVYAQRGAFVGGKWTTVMMHRTIFGLTDRTLDVDHIDHNGLNNQRSNLRPCTRSQNNMNRRLGKDSTSGIKGVSWKRSDNAWRAQIKLDGKTVHLGFFPTKEAGRGGLRCGGQQAFRRVRPRKGGPMKYTDSILDACIARVHAAIVHDKAIHGEPLPDFSPQYWIERERSRQVAHVAKYKATMKAKGAAK
jgi:hypothetical protein